MQKHPNKPILNIQHPTTPPFGYSIIEMLIAVGVFAIVGIVITNSLASSFKNSQKTNSISNVKSNVDYAMSTMERLLRNAVSIDTTNSTPTRLVYEDEYGNSDMFFNCDSSGGFIASGSATLGTNIRLSSTNTVIDCTGVVFTYPPSSPGVPQIVEMTLTGSDSTTGTGVEGASVTSKSRVILRNYSN